MAKVTSRLSRRVRHDFGTSSSAVLILLEKVPEQFPGCELQNVERLQAALVLGTNGDVHSVALRVVTGVTDWRDLLVGSGLANGDWPLMLDSELDGTFTGWLSVRRRRQM